MKNLLVFRENLKNFYAKFEVYITPALKFITAFITLMMINQNINFMGKLNSVAIVLIVALMCSFLPYNFIILFASIFVVAHLYKLSLEIAIFTIFIFLLLYLLYFRFSPKDTFVVLLVPVCFMLKLPFVIPLAMGLIAAPASMVSVGCGVIVYYLIQFVHTNASSIVLMDEDGSLTRFRFIVDGMLNNKAMLIMILAMAVTITMVYLIKRLAIDHAWSIAIVTGALVNIVVLLIGDLIYDTNINIVGTFFGMIVSVGIVFALKFFIFNVDYTRTENVQFEDDEYYYYVKAVPKNTVPQRDRSVTRINVQKRETRVNDDIKVAPGRTSQSPNVTRSQTMTRTTTQNTQNTQNTQRTRSATEGQTRVPTGVKETVRTTYTSVNRDK